MSKQRAEIDDWLMIDYVDADGTEYRISGQTDKEVKEDDQVITLTGRITHYGTVRIPVGQINSFTRASWKHDPEITEVFHQSDKTIKRFEMK